MECPRYSERGKFVEVKSSAKKTRKKKLTSGKLRMPSVLVVTLQFLIGELKLLSSKNMTSTSGQHALDLLLAGKSHKRRRTYDSKYLVSSVRIDNDEIEC